MGYVTTYVMTNGIKDMNLACALVVEEHVTGLIILDVPSALIYTNILILGGQNNDY